MNMKHLHGLLYEQTVVTGVEKAQPMNMKHGHGLRQGRMAQSAVTAPSAGRDR